MYYYLGGFNWILTVSAIVPAIVLLKFIYNEDRLEKESGRLLLGLVLAGIISTAIALAGEKLGSYVLSMFFNDERSVAYRLWMYFIVVGVSEEGGKYLLLKKRTWKSPEFNCRFDGVIYATFVSLGFALWENIEYVLMYGFSTAVLRAVTAVPGHCCFGVFMGVFYGLAKKHENFGHHKRSKSCRVLALVVPIIIHGTYDYIATLTSGGSGLIFLVFIVLVFVASFALVRNMSKYDTYIDVHDDYVPWVH